MDCATVAQAALELVWPEICAHCREDLPKGPKTPLCPACQSGLRGCEPPHCERCAEPLTPGRSHCRECSTRLYACARVRAAFLYKGPAVSIVHAFKYRGRRSAARSAGLWMAAALPRFSELHGAELLVPMPLHPSRRRERGYNQALLIAESLSAASGIPLDESLARTRRTDPLWALGRSERQQSLSGAFLCTRPGMVRGRKVLLVDDVCTTGASLESCAEALLSAGAASVDGLVFARQANPIRN